MPHSLPGKDKEVVPVGHADGLAGQASCHINEDLHDVIGQT